MQVFPDGTSVRHLIDSVGRIARPDALIDGMDSRLWGFKVKKRCFLLVNSQSVCGKPTKNVMENMISKSKDICSIFT
jgi:hypothetical protein